jgi:hypothetical protein
MKMILMLLLAALPAFGQGTINFQTTLDGAHAIPPNSTSLAGWGAFEVRTGNLFVAAVQVFDPVVINGTSVALFRATNPTEIGTQLFELPFYNYSPPAPGGEGGGAATYILNQTLTLTLTQVSDLQSGYWWVSVVTPAFPNGEIRGQITPVPEPSTWALIGAGSALAAVRQFLHRGPKQNSAAIV